MRQQRMFVLLYSGLTDTKMSLFFWPLWFLVRFSRLFFIFAVRNHISGRGFLRFLDLYLRLCKVSNIMSHTYFILQTLLFSSRQSNENSYNCCFIWEFFYAGCFRTGLRIVQIFLILCMFIAQFRMVW
jgi:hypothetical protein